MQVLRSFAFGGAVQKQTIFLEYAMRAAGRGNRPGRHAACLHK